MGALPPAERSTLEEETHRRGRLGSHRFGWMNEPPRRGVRAATVEPLAWPTPAWDLVYGRTACARCHCHDANDDETHHHDSAHPHATHAQIAAGHAATYVACCAKLSCSRQHHVSQHHRSYTIHADAAARRVAAHVHAMRELHAKHPLTIHAYAAAMHLAARVHAIHELHATHPWKDTTPLDIHLATHEDKTSSRCYCPSLSHHPGP